MDNISNTTVKQLPTNTIKDKEDNKLERLFENYRLDYDIAKKSTSWFGGQVNALLKAGITTNTVLNSKDITKTTKLVIGKLYMYMYEPINKLQLLYYDKFPLVFPWNITKTSFSGINMHYLPYKARAVLFDSLLTFANNKRFDQTTKLRLYWEVLSKSAKYKAVLPCVRQYSFMGIKGSFIEIPAEDWPLAMMLPVEKFNKATKDTIWKDSTKIIMKQK